MKFFELIIVLCLIIFTYQDCNDNNKKEDCKLSDDDKKEDMNIVALLKMVILKIALD